MTPQLPKDSVYVMLTRMDGKLDHLVKADTDKETRIRRLEKLLVALAIVVMVGVSPEAASLIAGSV